MSGPYPASVGDFAALVASDFHENINNYVRPGDRVLFDGGMFFIYFIYLI